MFIPDAIMEAASVVAELHAQKTTIAFGAGGLVLDSVWGKEPNQELIDRFVAAGPALVASLGLMIPIKYDRVGWATGCGWKRWVLS